MAHPERSASTRRSVTLMLLALPALATLPAQAQDRSAADRDAIRGIIGGQLDAFLRDDSAAAFGYASPGIQRMFGTQDTFMSMVREGYPPVYRPKERVFGALRETASGPEQEVAITDSAGEAWTAVYSLEQQPDGVWRISGCRLVKGAGPSV